MHYVVVGAHLCTFFLKFFAPSFLVQIVTKENEFSLNPVLLFERNFFLLERGFKHSCMPGNAEKISQKFHSEFFFTWLACFGPLNHASNQAFNRGYIFVFLICQKKNCAGHAPETPLAWSKEMFACPPIMSADKQLLWPLNNQLLIPLNGRLGTCVEQTAAYE